MIINMPKERQTKGSKRYNKTENNPIIIRDEVKFNSRDEVIDVTQPSKILEMSRAQEMQEKFENLDRVIINESKNSKYSQES